MNRQGKHGDRMTDSFEQSLIRGDWIWAFRWALVTGGLWGVGSAWATAIRSIVLLLLPDRENTAAVVGGELGAATLTTLIVATLAVYVISGKHCRTATRAAGRTRFNIRTRIRAKVTSDRTAQADTSAVGSHETPPVLTATQLEQQAAAYRR